MKIKAPDESFIKITSNLNEEEKDRLLSRMRGKLTGKFENQKMELLEVLAIQLETEDAELVGWREKMNEIKAKEKLRKNKSHNTNIVLNLNVMVYGWSKSN